MIATDSDARALLREGAAALLEMKRMPELAQLVRAAQVEISDEHETWEMGVGKVEAQRIALIVDPYAYVKIRENPNAFAEVREAFANAVRSFETELAELSVLLRLEAPHTAWQHIYRQAPRWSPPEPSSAAVHVAAISLGRASQHHPRTVAILERAELEVESVGEPAERLTRWLVRLAASDFIEVDRDSEQRALIEYWVRSAAASVRGRVGEIAFGVRPPQS